MSKHFLFLFADTGSGHRSGALAVSQAMKNLYKDDVTVILVDVFAELQKWPFDRFAAWYPIMVKGRSLPWKVAFELTDSPAAVNSLTRLARPYVRTSFQHLLTRHPVDAVVSFHPIPNRLLALEAARTGSNIRTATVVLDFLSAPAFWFARGLDLYIVPYAETLERASRLSPIALPMEALGMPVRKRILEGRQLSRQEAKKALDLPSSRPLVLLAGGGDGVGPLEEITCGLLDARPQASVAVITGRNERLQRHLTSFTQTHSLRVEGFTRQMDLWLRAADILVTKAGPNSLAEAFVMGLPTVIYAAIPGQEDGNVTLVTEQGAGLWAPGAKASVDAILALLSDPLRREQMARRARSLATPEGSVKIAQRLWRLIPGP